MAWNDLSDREKSLDRAIEACGVKLDSSSSCLRNVMGKIGAKSSEEAFVASRIQLRLKTQDLLGETDQFIADTEAMLEKFKRDDEEWERRGRDLGFKF